ncbi:MAG: hypothetical protein KC912_23715 [Proteobacteria bacterium]|nr:hypothetical protein [Pseudomonadota bacterium]
MPNPSHIALVLTLIACKPTDGSEVPTENLFADVVVQRPGGALPRTKLTVAFAAALGGSQSPENVALGEGDVVVVRARDYEDGEPIDTDYEAERTTGPFASYEVRLPVTEYGEEFRIGLTREPENTSAPQSEVRLPPAFTPSVPDVLRAGEQAELTWTTYVDPDTTMRIDIASACLELVEEPLFPVEVPDTGSYVFDVDNAAWTTGSEPCDVTVAFDRVRTGALDPTFAGGSVEAAQVRDRETAYEVAN